MSQPLIETNRTQPAVQGRGDVAVPLVIDLDGTLVATDLLLECFFIVLRQHPLRLLLLPWWLLHGVARLKRELARLAVPDVHTLPYRRELVSLLEAEKQRGRPLVMATASDRILADAVAQDLKLFDAVFASDGSVNLAGEHKCARLVAQYGSRGFDYVGSGRGDRPVWAAARVAIVVDGSDVLGPKPAQGTRVERVLASEAAPLGSYLTSLRPHQWLKNAMVLVPLAVGHQFFAPGILTQALLAFLAFCLCASGTYLLNDLLDLPSDRRHPRKRLRPLASGRMPILHAALLSPGLVAAGFAVGASLPWPFLVVLTLYCILATTYSMRLKDIPILDVLVLAGLNAARVVAGSAALTIALSPWFLAFCFLLFFSLALIKRYAELMVMRTIDGERAHARAYLLKDAELLAALGGATGIVAVLLLALGVDQTKGDAGVAQQGAVWLVCGLLVYWISYMWLMAHRACMHDDPLLFALTDRTSQRIAVLIGATLLAATVIWGSPLPGGTP
jgi:4-hydroxybenzoate polyprenyltransferase